MLRKLENHLTFQLQGLLKEMNMLISRASSTKVILLLVKNLTNKKKEVKLKKVNNNNDDEIHMQCIYYNKKIKIIFIK